MALPIGPDDVDAAAERIEGAVVRTSCALSRTLSDITGAEVVIKFENLQFTASYKERGALNRLLLLPEGTPGVVTSSAGNFAQAVAHHAARLGLPAVIVMPAITPSVKVTNTRQLGAEIVLHGDALEDARDEAERIARDRGYELLSPFNDVDVMAGQGTVAREMLADDPDLEVLVVPTGGGGLLAGCAVAARAAKPDIEIVGVQSDRWPAVYNAVNHTALTVGDSTIAEGIAVGEPGDDSLEIIRELVDSVEIVSESLIEQAVGLFLEVEKTVAEGAGAAALAELLGRPDRYAGRRVGLILSGGNIDLRQLSSVIMRALVRSGRLGRMVIEVPDSPGSLGRITTTVGELGGNIIDVVHRRLDLTVHAKLTGIELLVETSDRDHLDRLLAGLRAAGFHVRVL
jgi:threonine dehydratase